MWVLGWNIKFKLIHGPKIKRPFSLSMAPILILSLTLIIIRQANSEGKNKVGKEKGGNTVFICELL